MAHASTLSLAPARLSGAFGLSLLMRLDALARQRRRLASLDDAALADLGLTRQEAAQEAARPVWDVPAHWR